MSDEIELDSQGANMLKTGRINYDLPLNADRGKNHWPDDFYEAITGRP